MNRILVNDEECTPQTSVSPLQYILLELVPAFNYSTVTQHNYIVHSNLILLFLFLINRIKYKQYNKSKI